MVSSFYSWLIYLIMGVFFSYIGLPIAMDITILDNGNLAFRSYQTET